MNVFLKKHWIFLFIIIACALLQITILNYIKIFNVKPDLLFISVVITSLLLEFRSAVLFSIFAGILKDALSINAFGINTILFALSCCLIIALSKKISLDNNLIRMASVFVIMLINNIITRLIFLFLGNFISLGVFLRVTFIESLYTALVLPLALKIIKPLFYYKTSY